MGVVKSISPFPFNMTQRGHMCKQHVQDNQINIQRPREKDHHRSVPTPSPDVLPCPWGRGEERSDGGGVRVKCS